MSTDNTLTIEELESITNAIAQTDKIEPPTPTNPTALQTFVSAEELQRDITINMLDLDSAVIRHASLYVYYATQAALARRQFERTKAAVEILESRLDHHYRKQAIDEGKKVTENSIASSVKSDRRWHIAQDRLATARAIMDLANDAREAFAQRKDMIVQLAVDRRVERERSMVFRSSQTLQEAGQMANKSAQAMIAGASS